MRTTRTRLIAAGAAAALLAPIISVLTPGTGSALPPSRSSSCKNLQNPGAEMGMYPADPAGQSSLKISCLFESDIDSANYMISYGYTIHDFENVVYHNGAARWVTNSSAVAVNASAIQIGATQGGTLSTWVNRSITGPGIAPRTFVTSITAGGQVNLSELTTAATAVLAGSFKIDNATGARSLDSATVTGGANTITTAAGVGTSANFQASDADPDGAGPLLGLSITGTRIPAGCTIDTVVNANSATMACVANGAGATSGNILFIGGTLVVNSARSVDDATRDATAQRIVSLAGRNSQDDIGLAITGAGLASGAVITAVSGAGSKNLTIGGGCAPSCVLSTSAVAQTVVIGSPTGTATANGDTVMNLGLQLDLTPASVPGAGNCALEQAEGFIMVGKIYQPGSFKTPLFAASPPAGQRALAQIIFDTATQAEFAAAYLVEKSAASPGDPNLSAHYDVVFPFMPLTVAACAGDPTTSYDSPGMGESITVLGNTASQAALALGLGRPGTAQFRSVKASTAGYTSTAYLDAQPTQIFLPTANFSRICIYPAAPGEVSFTCGNG